MLTIFALTNACVKKQLPMHWSDSVPGSCTYHWHQVSLVVIEIRVILFDRICEEDEEAYIDNDKKILLKERGCSLGWILRHQRLRFAG